MNQFYAPPEQRAGDLIAIGGEEARHITKVLRYTVGQQVILTDGCGNRYDTIIESISKRDLYCKIQNQQKFKKSPGRVLLLGHLHKRQRVEWLLEKGTELGITSFMLFEADHSQRASIKEDRAEQILISAMKQSGRYYLPELHLLNGIEEAISQTKEMKHFVGHQTAENNRKLFQTDYSSQDLAFWIGPEGGFSERETQLLVDIGAHLVQLGNFRLRAETAALALVSQFVR